MIGVPPLCDRHAAIGDRAAFSASQAQRVAVHPAGDAVEHGVFVVRDLQFGAPVLRCPPQPWCCGCEIEVGVARPRKAAIAARRGQARVAQGDGILTYVA